MQTMQCRPGKALRLAALIVLLLSAGSASAQQCSVVLQNGTTQAIVVQASAIVGTRVIRARPQIVQATKTSLPILIPGNQVLITLSDPRIPTMVIARATFLAPVQGVKLLKLIAQKSPLGIHITKLP